MRAAKHSEELSGSALTLAVVSYALARRPNNICERRLI